MSHRSLVATVQSLIAAAMDLERRTMELYCQFENRFRRPEELRRFWFEMAQHEAQHFGALALLAALLDAAPRRALPPEAALTPARIEHLRALLDSCRREAAEGVSLERAFEMCLDIEASEIEDVVLDLLHSLKGAAARTRALQLLIHDLGDLGYMIEKYTTSQSLLARADALLETQVGRLRLRPPRPTPSLRRVKG
ncbi:MAG: hypothetical protein HY699_01765 [Deltaproteobacteria bacterium]|nr:hypothetical protein [Deltaproteobacteria bacterium]